MVTKNSREYGSQMVYEDSRLNIEGPDGKDQIRNSEGRGWRQQRKKRAPVHEQCNTAWVSGPVAPARKRPCCDHTGPAKRGLNG